MYLMVGVVIFYQFGLFIIVRVEGKVLSEDIQIFGWGGEAVVVVVEIIVVVDFYIVKL